MATAVNTSTQSAFGFDPRTIPGCAVWLDAADINTFTPANPTAGTAISQWNDKSGNNRHATQSTLSNRPVYSSSDLSIDTTTNPRFFNMTSMPAAPYDIFVVARPTASTVDWRTMFRTSTDNPGLNPVVLLAGSSNLGYYASNAFAQFGSYTWAPSTRNMLFARMNATRTMNASLNGDIALTADTIAPGAASDVILYLGATVVGGTVTQGWGNINEVIFYTTPLTTGERQQVEGYLASKWGLRSNIPPGHPFKNNPPIMRAFQPTDITECALWLDAAHASRISPSNITSGTAITSWADKSASGTSAIPQKGASGITPTFSTATGRPSIFIDNGGVNANYNASTYAQLQIQSNIQTSADYSVFAVVSLSNVTTAINQTIYTNTRGGTNRAPQWGPGSTFEVSTTGSFRQANNGTFLGTGIQQTSLVSSPNLFIQYKNGVSYASEATTLANRYTADANPLPLLGGTFDGTSADNRFTTGHFHEVILYNKALTTSERQEVEGYLAEKWRTPDLPTTHPFYLQRVLPSTATFFSPGLLSNLLIWIDPADPSTVVLSGSTVTSVRDKSSIRALFDQGTTKPTNVTPINGLTTLNFPGGSGATNVLGTAASSAYNNISQFSLFIVNRPTWASGTLSQAPCMFGIRSNTTTMVSWHTMSSYGSSSYVVWNGSTTTQPSITTSQNELLLFEVIQGATSYVPYKNGTPATAVTYTITGQTGLPASIGNIFSGGNEGFQGQIAEVLFFSRTLVDSERQLIEGYLAWKWGLQASLPAGHPYLTFRP
jgi:hypothetical protein